MSMKLYVGNLSFQTTNEDLQALFEQAGTVESVNVIEPRISFRAAVDFRRSRTFRPAQFHPPHPRVLRHG